MFEHFDEGRTSGAPQAPALCSPRAAHKATSQEGPPSSQSTTALPQEDAVAASHYKEVAPSLDHHRSGSCAESLNSYYSDSPWPFDIASGEPFVGLDISVVDAPDQPVPWQQCIDPRAVDVSVCSHRDPVLGPPFTTYYGSDDDQETILDLVKWYIDVPVAGPNLATSMPSPRVDSKGVVQVATNSCSIADNNMIGKDRCNTYIDPSKLNLQAQPRGGELDDLEDLGFKDTWDDATGSAWIVPGTGRSDTSSQGDSSYVCLREVRDEPNVTVPSRPAKKPRARARNPVLEEWLLANAAYPYPDADQLSALSQLSGRSLRQTRNALSNLRARKRPDLSTNPTCAGLTVYSGHSNAPRMAYTSETTLPTISTVNHATPYGIGAYPSPMSTQNDADHDFRHDCFETFEHSAPDEIMGRNVSAQLDGALAPAAPIEGAFSLRRKGKRRHGSRYEACNLDLDSSTRHNKSELNPLTTETPRFHCTICPKSFKNAWSWRRHEYGTHDFYPVEWTCMLHEAITIGMTCIFCAQPVDDYHHFDQHNIVACSQRDPASRTFALEDRLKQHVQQIHLLEADDTLKKAFKPPAMWSRTVEAEKVHPDSLWCGFCCISLQSTTLRMDHVAQHFRDGLSMVGWNRRPIE